MKCFLTLHSQFQPHETKLGVIEKFFLRHVSNANDCLSYHRPWLISMHAVVPTAAEPLAGEVCDCLAKLVAEL